MSILHIVNRSPLTHSCLASCLRFASLDDGILFIQDGVYAALTSYNNLLPFFNQFCFYALIPDIQARGLAEQLHKPIQLVDYTGFVDLAIRYAKIQSWF